jgi:hypothetical protein
MAPQAQGSHVGEIAFAATFDDRDDMVSIPEVAAVAPLLFKLAARSEIEFALVFAQTLGVEATQGADAAVAGEDLFAEISGVGAQLPLVDAGGTAEGEPPARNYAAASPARTGLPLDPTARLDATGAHTRSS